MSKGPYADHFRHLQTLLDRTLARSLPSARALAIRAELQENLTKTRRALWAAETARLEEKLLRQLRREHLETGRDLAARLRCAIRAILGPYDERLTAFGIAPVRKRKPRG